MKGFLVFIFIIFAKNVELIIIILSIILLINIYFDFIVGWESLTIDDVLF